MRRTGVDYDTDWARSHGARVARAVILDDVLKPVIHAIASPTVHGEDRLVGLEAPAIFVANHHSHLDTALLLTSLPERFRHRAVVAAAADYFFPSRARGAMSALAIGAIPMERTKVGRRSADLAAELLEDGWNLIMFPEGGRSPDGWGRAFRGGAAYLALRCGRPVVPLYMEGTGRLWKRGTRWPKVAKRGQGVHLVFGAPMWPEEGEDARRLAARVERAVGALADEWSTDWWSARRRAAT
ncbi:MAG: lysophospholipid acyltransferase family protein, partial [Acidimicrobiales bacterium]